MKPTIDKSDPIVVTERQPALVKIDGLWVHQGVGQPEANWDRLIREVLEERIEFILKL
jgi:hypothetical protein